MCGAHSLTAQMAAGNSRSLLFVVAVVQVVSVLRVTQGLGASRRNHGPGNEQGLQERQSLSSREFSFVT